MAWLVICTFFLPAPLAVSAAENSHNAHVLRRLNGPERARAIEEAARLEAAAREKFAKSEAAASTVPAPVALSPHENAPAQLPAPASRESAVSASADASRPQSVGEVLFNYAAGFAGVPGLSPRQGVDGSLDEGLGFHQDGTARKAGGVAGSSGPSDRGRRADAYMRTGLQNGYGMAGYAPGLYGDFDLFGRNDPTRGGRVSSSSGYSRDLGGFDPMNMAIDKGLNWALVL